MLSVLISLLILCLIASVVWFVLGQLPLPPVARQIAIAIVALVFLIYLIDMLVGLPGATHPLLR